MYLLGTFIGSNGKITITKDSKKAEVEAFLKANPTLKNRIADKKRIAAQCKLMGIEVPVEKKKKVATK